jgi:hypothetical protein
MHLIITVLPHCAPAWRTLQPTTPACLALHMQALASRSDLPREAVEAGCDAYVEAVIQDGVDEYQQTKHQGGITTCSIKSNFAKQVAIVAAFIGGDHYDSQKINLATAPSAEVQSVFKQFEEVMSRGFLVLDCSTSPLWGQVSRLYIKLCPLITSDWPSLLAQSGLGPCVLLTFLLMPDPHL